jgi:ribonuclease HII
MIVCGVDEAGRGPLAGPVYAAAVILDPAKQVRGLADSKVLKPERREVLAERSKLLRRTSRVQNRTLISYARK